ncbi:hypothetical protein IF2G_09916 [Cordyceps javanica]|nr:hypothetical protein IF2G_09916 [Cordyceps javanica]
MAFFRRFICRVQFGLVILRQRAHATIETKTKYNHHAGIWHLNLRGAIELPSMQSLIRKFASFHSSPTAPTASRLMLLHRVHTTCSLLCAPDAPPRAPP